MLLNTRRVFNVPPVVKPRPAVRRWSNPDAEEDPYGYKRRRCAREAARAAKEWYRKMLLDGYYLEAELRFIV